MALALPVYEANAEAPDSLALPAFVTAAETPASLKLPVFVTAAEASPSLKLPVWLLTENIPSTLTVVPTGGVALGGAPFIGNDPWFPAGGITLGGAATVSAVAVMRLEWYPAGGAVLGGAATVSSAWLEFVPTGGVALGGAAVVSGVVIQHYEIPAPTGGVSVGGAADIPHTCGGGVVLGGAAEVSVMYPTIVVPAGGVVLGGAAVTMYLSAHTPEGGVQLGGSAPSAGYFPAHVPEGGVVLGGAAIMFMLPAGTISTTENPYNDAFPGWAVNLDTDAPSRYTGLAANSICRHGKKTYVANAGGIYEVTGDTDAGQPIRAAFMPPKSDFKSSNSKRVGEVWAALRSSGRLALRVTTNENDSQYYSIAHDGDEGVRNSRVKLGKGLEGRYWQMQINNVDGAWFEISSLEFEPAISARRKK